jgi:hypothetical protein
VSLAGVFLTIATAAIHFLSAICRQAISEPFKGADYRKDLTAPA